MPTSLKKTLENADIPNLKKRKCFINVDESFR